MIGDWSVRAVCRRHDPELFFPAAGRAGDAQEARAVAVCHTCPVMLECRAWADASRQPRGVWGGQRREKLPAPALRRGRPPSRAPHPVAVPAAPPPMDEYVRYALAFYGARRRETYGA
jgi:WhiB family transcriptional regulator, redox-sensing transcriptional regulator